MPWRGRGEPFIRPFLGDRQLCLCVICLLKTNLLDCGLKRHRTKCRRRRRTKLIGGCHQPRGDHSPIWLFRQDPERIGLPDAVACGQEIKLPGIRCAILQPLPDKFFADISAERPGNLEIRGKNIA